MERFDVDAPPASAEEGLFLCVYHIAMASIYFEVINENVDSAEFLGRVYKIYGGLGNTAARLWYEEMYRVYKEET